MKNSASHSSIIQALHAQAQQLLPIVTQTLSTLQYSEIVHQRLSQQNIEQTHNTETQSTTDYCYQGLMRAKHPQFDSVMVKWQLNAHSSQYSSDINHEIEVLKSLQGLYQNQSDSAAIAPLILAHHKLDVQVLGQSQQLTALVMPHYPNGSLANQLHRQKYPLLTDKQKHRFIHQTVHLIAKLHHAGWTHNDIKPSNILLSGTLIDRVCDNSRPPELLMTDFSLAEIIHNPIKSNPAGTPAYLAPERWQGQAATVQSDIYALGIMMVEILMGKRPYQIPTQSCDPMMDWATQHCQQPIPKLPSEYSHYQFIINKALAKRVERRYKTIEEIQADLEAF